MHLVSHSHANNALSSLQDVTVGRFGHHHNNNKNNQQQLRHANSLADFGTVLVVPADGSTHHGGHYFHAGLSPSASQGHSSQLPTLPAHLAEAYSSSPGLLSTSQQASHNHRPIQHGGSGGVPASQQQVNSGGGLPHQQQRREYASDNQVMSWDGRNGLGGSGASGAVGTGGAGQRLLLKHVVTPLPSLSQPHTQQQHPQQQPSPAGSPVVVPGSPSSAVSASSNATAWRRLFSSRDNSTTAASNSSAAAIYGSGGANVMAQQAAALAPLAVPSPLQHRTGPSDALPQAANGSARVLASPTGADSSGAGGNSDPLSRVPPPPRRLLTQQRSVNYQATAAAIASVAADHQQEYVHSNSSPCVGGGLGGGGAAAAAVATNGSGNLHSPGGKAPSPPAVASATITLPTPALAIASRAAAATCRDSSIDGTGSGTPCEAKPLKHTCASADQIMGGLAAAAAAAAAMPGGGPSLNNLSVAIQLAPSLSGPPNLTDLLPSPLAQQQQKASGAAADLPPPPPLQLPRIATPSPSQQQQQPHPGTQWASSPPGVDKAAAAAAAAPPAAAVVAAATPIKTSVPAADGPGDSAAGLMQTELLAQGRSLPAGMRRSHWCLEDYIVTRRLFKGSRTAVYKATCKYSGAAVALKVGGCVRGWSGWVLGACPQCRQDALGTTETHSSKSMCVRVCAFVCVCACVCPSACACMRMCFPWRTRPHEPRRVLPCACLF